MEQTFAAMVHMGRAEYSIMIIDCLEIIEIHSAEYIFCSSGTYNIYYNGRYDNIYTIMFILNYILSTVSKTIVFEQINTYTYNNLGIEYGHQQSTKRVVIHNYANTFIYVVQTESILELMVDFASL